MKNIIIRKEKKEDYKQTEYMTMRAFWNLHGPGCNEHLLVRIMREAEEYLPEISRVAELDGKIVGLIMYFKAQVQDGDSVHEVVSFGPLCVEPTLRNSGVGEMLLKETIKLARQAGYPGIIIFGEPDYYPKHGFRTCDNYGVTTADGSNFDAFMAYPLDEDKFSQIKGQFLEGEFLKECENQEKLAEITGEFPYHKPLELSCQWLHEESLGQICKVQKNTYYIKFWEMELQAKLKGTYSKNNEEPPVVGDYVTFRFNPIGDSIITSVCERKSVLKRPDFFHISTNIEQVMCTNFDYTFIVASLNDNYNFNRIARYVSITLQGNGIPVVILTKADLCNNPGRYVREIEDLSDKVRVHSISALYGIGTEELDEYLQPGKIIALIGSSGVGKSTLVNALTGEETMKTGGIREDDSKGRHTTTHRQLVELPSGAVIIDTPGMREIGMCDVDDGIDETFEDITELECQCKFSDCKHKTEPGCAVKAALENGSLSFERLSLYQNLHNESSKAAKMKEISKYRKIINKSR